MVKILKTRESHGKDPLHGDPFLSGVFFFVRCAAISRGVPLNSTVSTTTESALSHAHDLGCKNKLVGDWEEW